MTNKKPTKKQMYEQILAHTTNEDEKAFLLHEIELLDKKAGKGAEKKLTPEQEKNEKVKAGILEALEGGEQMTISQMIKEVPIIQELFPDASNQKISALVRQLVQSLVVERVEVKGVAYFKKA
jgi:hypothetical protein